MRMKDQQEERGAPGGRSGGSGTGVGARGTGGSSSSSSSRHDMGDASVYARRFQCSAKEVHAFAMGCRRPNDGIGSMCSRQDHEMEIGEEVYFWDGSGKNLPTAYCANMECFLGDLHESTIFHALGKRLISGMMVCQECSYKSDIEGGMAQCKADGHPIKAYRSKQEYRKAHAQDSGEESHTYYARQILAGQKFRTLWDTEAVLYWDHGVYLDHGEVLVKMLAEKQVENCTTHMRTEILNTIRATTVVQRDRFDAVPGIVNVRNGLLRIDGMAFGPHDPDHLSRVQLNAEYDPDAGAEGFERFLAEVIPDREDRETLMEVVSTALVGNQVNLEKIVMFVGEGHNGKSTLLEVISEVLGQGNISHVSIHQLIEERFARAELDGKMANIYADISANEITNLGVIKSLVTGEPVMAEYKGQPIFVLRNKAKLVFSCNRLPDIGEDSDAVFRRFIIINFPVQFDGASDNPNLKRELTTEREKSGILNMMLASLRRVIDNGGKLTHGKTIDSMRDAWRTQSDHIKRFAADCLRKADGHNEDKTDVYQAYTTYCRFAREQPMDNQPFSRRMSRLGYRHGKARVNGRAVNAWLGVKLQIPDEVGGGGGGSGGGGAGGSASESGGSGGGADSGDRATLRAGDGGSGGAPRPGGRDGIVLDVLREMCKRGGDGGGLAKRAELVEELGKTGLFPTGRDAEAVLGRLVKNGWIVDSGGGGNDSGGTGSGGTGSGGTGSGGTGGVEGASAASGGKDGDPMDGMGSVDGTTAGDAAAGAGAVDGGAAPAAAAAAAPAAAAAATTATASNDGDGRPRRRFRCESCPAGPFHEDEVGFGGKRVLDYHSEQGHRIEWIAE